MTTHLETPLIHLRTDETLPGLFISLQHDLSPTDIEKLPKHLSVAMKKVRTCPGDFQFIIINMEKGKWERQVLAQFLETTVTPYIHLSQVHTFFIRPSDSQSRKLLVEALLTIPNLNIHVHNTVEEILTQVNYVKNLRVEGHGLKQSSNTPLLQRVKNLVRNTLSISING